MKKTITVFGSSKPKYGEEEYNTAYELGKLIGQNGFNVCTGGYQGIMDGVSKGTVEKGGEAIGVTVNIFNAVPSRHLTQEIECGSLFERLNKLIEIGDAFIILPGGTGTLLELSVLLEFFNKGLLDSKPSAIFGNMWKEIIDAVNKRMEYEGRKTGIIPLFYKIEEAAKYVFERIDD